MTTLSDLFDLELFMKMEEEGYIRITEHPEQPLFIANYSEKAQYERVWNEVTLNCRGLIFNVRNEVIARGFPKFFNWDDSGQPYPPQGPMVLSTKFDGSLGIVYRTEDGELSVATRGSFASNQAIHATNWLRTACDGAPKVSFGQIHDMLDRGFTPLVEIIYPENRIVVDYHGADTLILLDVINNATGMSDLTEFDSLYWFNKAEKRLIPGGFSDSLVHDIPEGEEGFVLYWPASGFRCKMKAAAYVELHRMVTGLSEKTLWEALGRGETVEQIKENIPDELFAWVDEKSAALYEKAGAILDQAQDDYYSAYALTIRNLDSVVYRTKSERDAKFRGTFARIASSFPATRAYLFKILDGADEDTLWSMAWKTIRPVGDTRVWNQSSEDAE